MACTAERQTTVPPDSRGRLATPSVFEESPTLLILIQVEIAARVDPDGMSPIPRASRGWTQPACQYLAIQVEEGDQAIQLRHIDHPVMVDVDVAGASQVFPLGQKLTLRGKDLDPIVLPVSHKHTTIGMHPYPMGDVELARGTLPRGSPRLLQGAIGREPVDTGVAIAIRDIELAPSPYSLHPRT